MEVVRRMTFEDSLHFDRLAGELSVGFIDLPDGELDIAIEHAARRVVDAFDLDGTILFQASDDGDLVDTHVWMRPGLSPLPPRLSAKEHLPWMLDKVTCGELVCFSTVDELPDVVDRESLRRFGTKSALSVPLSVGGRVIGAASFGAWREERRWTPEAIQRLRLVARVFAGALARRAKDQALHQALGEVQRMREGVCAENAYRRSDAPDFAGTGTVVGQSAAVRRVMEQVQQVAPTDTTVLLLGETGTGKELFAAQIHEFSRRHRRAMVSVNCAAIPTTLIESELFGREKGAYTGALSKQIGRFEIADGSTIFLDEIGDLPSDVQVKLLRVLEQKQIERLGSSRAIKLDTRIIAATHRDLERRTEDGTFREDLYYRLNVFPIQVPPLRERPEDIPLLVWRFIEEFSHEFGKRIESISEDNMAALQRYSWPGNIRELRNVLERAMIVASGSRLTIDLPPASAAATRHSVKLADMEKEHIRNVLKRTDWRVRGEGGAADRLGLKPTTLENRMAKLGIRRPHAS
jgi:formate hydrogenlyase transcriptional activator